MKQRRGVSLIEVMVALILFGLIATVHTVATMRYGLRTRVSALGASRAAAVATAVDLFSTMPRASIAAAAGCVDIADDAAYPHERCANVTATTATISRIEIIITPVNTALRADTVYVDRITGNSTPPFT
jgi:prepilin-type N-terminal cleavage/methylation domain-containing protein